jgi:hypothetical protein
MLFHESPLLPLVSVYGIDTLEEFILGFCAVLSTLTTRIMSNLTLHEVGPSKLSMHHLKIAVEGCVSSLQTSTYLAITHADFRKCHGSLDSIYNALEKESASRGWAVAEVDFLIICGDFQVGNFHPFLQFQLIINTLTGCSQ